jgi:hypothetical protein
LKIGDRGKTKEAAVSLLFNAYTTGMRLEEKTRENS